MAGESSMDSVHLSEQRLDQSDSIIVGHMTKASLYGPDSLTPYEDCSAEQDDRQSNISEASAEAWVVEQNLDWEDDPTDINNSTQQNSYEPEDWDAEMEANETPYDEDDVVTACEEQDNAIDYQWASEYFYEPSLHHAPSMQWSKESIFCTAHIEVDQFEDAEHREP